MLDFKTTTLKTLAPYISALLILIGYVKLSIYYDRFSIQIENYLSFSEVLILFVPDILFFAIMMFSVFFLSYVVRSKEKEDQNDEQKNKIIDQSKLGKRIKEHYKFDKGTFWISLWCIALAVAVYFIDSEKFWDLIFYLLIIPAFLLYIILLNEYKRKFMIDKGRQFDATINNLLLILFIFALNSIVSVSTDIQDVYKKSSHKITFVYNDETIETNSRIKYLGETEKYVFLYNNKEKKSTVYVKSKIDGFTIEKIED